VPSVHRAEGFHKYDITELRVEKKLATCNYVARAQGVKKLQLITAAKKQCKNLVIVNGEDLTRLAAASRSWLSITNSYNVNLSYPGFVSFPKIYGFS
jgi:hypothetical protein